MRLERRAGVVGLALWTAVNVGWSYALSTRGAAEPAHPNPVSPSAAEHPAPATPRRTLDLPADAREAVLAEMRVMLQAVQGALQAGARGDSAAVHTAVRPAGMAMAADPHLEELLPRDWMALALDTHRAFDSLPAAGADRAAILAGLGRITARCNACHEMYRLGTH
jgi:hypothetical protein